MRPLIDIYVTCWNEEKILPDFIKWYRDRIPNCSITVYDNQSTDRTFEIAKENNCRIITFDTNNQMDEATLMQIRNTCWKDSIAKWCLVVDADELVDINTAFLERPQFSNIFMCDGFEMFGTEEDTIDTLLYGCKSIGYSKPVLFKNVFEEINFEAGSHKANPVIEEGEILWNYYTLNLYHTKWRSWTNGIERAHLLAKKRSEHSKSMNWNIHYEFDDLLHKEYYENGMKNRIKVR